MTKSLLPTTAREWNNKYPRGTKVRFYPRGRRNGAESIETETKGAAYHNSSGTLFIPLKGFGEFGAGKPISSIEVVPAAAPVAALSENPHLAATNYAEILRRLAFILQDVKWVSDGPYEP